MTFFNFWWRKCCIWINKRIFLNNMKNLSRLLYDSLFVQSCKLTAITFQYDQHLWHLKQSLEISMKPLRRMSHVFNRRWILQDTWSHSIWDSQFISKFLQYCAWYNLRIVLNVLKINHYGLQSRLSIFSFPVRTIYTILCYEFYHILDGSKSAFRSPCRRKKLD